MARLSHFRGTKGGEVTTLPDIIFLKSEEEGGHHSSVSVQVCLQVSLCPETGLWFEAFSSHHKADILSGTFAECRLGAQNNLPALLRAEKSITR